MSRPIYEPTVNTDILLPVPLANLQPRVQLQQLIKDSSYLSPKNSVQVVGNGSLVVLRGTADVVSSAPELARLTLNIAATHHDSRVGGRRLVYGGHTIGLALAQASRLLPNKSASARHKKKNTRSKFRWRR